MRSLSSLIVACLVVAATPTAISAVPTAAASPIGTTETASRSGTIVQEEAADAVADPASAATRDSLFIELMNEERTSAGLNALVPYFDLEDDAAAHTATMRASGDIFHSADIKGFATGWEIIGENVGYGPNVEKIHNAFMASPSHRANIMGDYDRVGLVSEVDDSGRVYVTVLFMKTLGGYDPAADLPIGAGIAATIDVGESADQ